MALERGDGGPVLLQDSVYFPMQDDGQVVACCVTFNALAMKAKVSTWLSGEEAVQIFLTYRAEIEAAAADQYRTGTRIVTIGAAELSP